LFVIHKSLLICRSSLINSSDQSNRQQTAVSNPLFKAAVHIRLYQTRYLQTAVSNPLFKAAVFGQPYQTCCSKTAVQKPAVQ
jgi:hypothetical protein